MEKIMEEKTRSQEVELIIEATVEQVWKALTDAVELSRWFPPSARVEPGPGGNIHLSWAPYCEGDNRIQVWDPPHHLRTGWFEQPETGTSAGVRVIKENPEEARLLAVDYFISSREGRTVLRLVHSGFSTSPKWDEEYDGVKRGWTYELRSLRHYLEKHLGQDRSTGWARRKVEAPDLDVWNRLMGTDGLLREGSIEGLVEGDRYAIQTATGDAFEGKVQVNNPPRDFSGTVDGLNGALLRVGIEGCTGQREVHLWVSGWGVSASEIKDRERRLNDLLERLFPDQSS
jgi:uncharacterized protein YndB with AHSA1/START domain